MTPSNTTAVTIGGMGSYIFDGRLYYVVVLKTKRFKLKLPQCKIPNAIAKTSLA